MLATPSSTLSSAWHREHNSGISSKSSCTSQLAFLPTVSRNFLPLSEPFSNRLILEGSLGSSFAAVRVATLLSIVPEVGALTVAMQRTEPAGGSHQAVAPPQALK